MGEIEVAVSHRRVGIYALGFIDEFMCSRRTRMVMYMTLSSRMVERTLKRILKRAE